MINASHGLLQIHSWESFHEDVTQVKQMCFKYLIYNEQFVLSPRNQTIIPNTCLGNGIVKTAIADCLRKQYSFATPERFCSNKMILCSGERHPSVLKGALPLYIPAAILFALVGTIPASSPPSRAPERA